MTTQITSLEHYKTLYKESVEDPTGFWGKEADTFTWFEPYQEVCQWNFREPDVKWFIGGKTNITYNCLDRHLAERGDQVAILWEPNEIDGEEQSYTYKELHLSLIHISEPTRPY